MLKIQWRATGVKKLHTFFGVGRGIYDKAEMVVLIFFFKQNLSH